jgi:S-DNA-T family DNA segregation ATPase FtsK/SpoIIIE
MSETERPQLHAVPAQEITGPAPQPPVYADITAPGELRPVLPYWLRGREEFRHAARRQAGRHWHRAKYHGLRLPWYVLVTAFWGVAGLGWLGWRWLRWWLFPLPPHLHAEAAQESWRAWKSLHAVHQKTAKTRALISAAVAAGVYVAGAAVWAHARLALIPAALVVALAAARFGRPDGVQIITPAQVPGLYEELTQDVITRALGSLGIAGIDRWLREGRQIIYPHPVRQDGPGWRAEVDLPYGVTATQVIERREQFASGLRRPLGAVWPEPVTAEHAGRLELWVGQQDVSKAKAPAWPLLKAGQADVFKPLPFAVDVRGRKVAVPLIYHNWLLGSIPRQGKTAAVRVLACGVALDPLAGEWIHELKGTGDLDPLEAVCHRFVSGIDDDSIGYAAESLQLLRVEIGRRAPELKGLPLELCPEKRVTRDVARRYRKLRPIVAIIDEAQNLFAHEKYGKQAGEDAEFIIKVGPAMGIVLVLATQRPDKASLPTGVSANVSIRFCLKVMGQLENDMILGTSAYKNGVRATTFRPKIDAGLGYLISEDPARVCRTYFLDVPDAKAVAARARALRERAGTLSGIAAGQEDSEAARDVLADVLAALGDDAGLHWEVLAARLAGRFPERWAGATGDALSQQCRDLGVASVSVRWPTSRAGTLRKGCRKDAVLAAAGRNTAGQSV